MGNSDQQKKRSTVRKVPVDRESVDWVFDLKRLKDAGVSLAPETFRKIGTGLQLRRQLVDFREVSVKDVKKFDIDQTSPEECVLEVKIFRKGFVRKDYFALVLILGLSLSFCLFALFLIFLIINRYY